MATAVTHAQTANPVLLAIEGNMRWTGPLTYNIVQIANAAELAAFDALIAPDPAMTMDLPARFVTEFQQAITVLSETINLNIQFNNDINADYLVGQDASGSLGVAGFPSPGQDILAINLKGPSVDRFTPCYFLICYNFINHPTDPS